MTKSYLSSVGISLKNTFQSFSCFHSLSLNLPSKQGSVLSFNIFVKWYCKKRCASFLSLRTWEIFIEWTRMAWTAPALVSAWVCCLFICLLGFSQDLQRRWIARSSTLEPNNVLYLSDYQIIHSIFFVVWYRKVPTKNNWFTKWTWHKTANKERICSCNWCFAHFFVASCNI